MILDGRVLSRATRRLTITSGTRFSTTDVYCRPSRLTRTANPKNVQLYDTLERVKATRFRPCKRFNPDEPSIERGNAALEILLERQKALLKPPSTS
jgi:methylphosphotriester-DNA--protein-cysteine methyltransferase